MDVKYKIIYTANMRSDNCSLVSDILRSHALVHDDTNESPSTDVIEDIADRLRDLVDPVGVAEIMHRCGVTRRSVDKWRERCHFPAQRWEVGGRSAWDWADVEAWGRATGRLREGGQWAMPGEMVTA